MVVIDDAHIHRVSSKTNTNNNPQKTINTTNNDINRAEVCPFYVDFLIILTNKLIDPNYRLN